MAGDLFIMVTNWENHWDNLPDNRASFAYGMLRDREKIEKIIKKVTQKDEKVQTLFVKVEKGTQRVQKAWIGYTYDFTKKRDAIFFKIDIRGTVNISLHGFRLIEGWYVIQNIIPNPEIRTVNQLEPSI